MITPIEQFFVEHGPDVVTSMGESAAPASDGVPEGQRNAWLTSQAGSMRRAGFSAAAIAAALSVENAMRCHPPLEEREVQAIATSIARYPAAADTEAPTAGFPIFNDVELLSRATPNSVVEGVLFEATFAPICGATDTWKTFLATSLGLSVATGRSWFGARIEAPGPAAIVLTEGAGLYDRRIRAWKVDHGVPLDTVVGFHTIPATVNFLSGCDVDRLIGQLLPLNLRVLFVDTLSRSLCGGNENKPDDMGRFVRQCDRIREAIGAIVSPIHHTGWDDSRERGHSSLRGAADTMFMVRRADDVVTISCEKQKDAAPFADFKLQLQFIPDADGCVLVPHGDLPKPAELTRTQHRTMETFRASFGADGATAATWIQAARLKAGNGYRIIHALEAAGYVEQSGKRGRFMDTGKPL